ncbi:MAG: type II secretion system protein [Planctomycetota bacterium]|nr:type II secretion system protein [Planctomycetota bacterium]
MRFRIKNRLSRAFTLIEILIVVVILGILAAIVIPQFTDASQQAMESSVVTQLQTLRSQIELHDVQWPMRRFDPIGDALAPWGQLTTGDLAFDLDYDGEYLMSPPVNPLQSSNTVAALPGAGVGWTWNDANGWGVGLYAVDENDLQFDIDGDGVFE